MGVPWEFLGLGEASLTTHGRCMNSRQTQCCPVHLAPEPLMLMAVSLPAAIEAMKNAHREEMERELEKSQRSQISSINSDIEALRRQYL